MALIELRTLGTLDLHSADGRELHSLLAQPKRVALLAYLCIAKPRGFHRRDKLLGLFWPNSDQDHARTSLRKSLHILRRALTDQAILSRGDEEVAVDFNRVSCDAAAFEASAKANRLEEALELYRGDLLAGFFIDEAPEFDQWLHSERMRLRASAARAALTLSDQYDTAGNVAAATGWARRSLELTDTDERALQKLIELQARSGDRTGAIQSYETFARRLAAEYETEPSAETRSLVERIRSGKTMGRDAGTVATVQTSLVGGQVGPSPTPSVAPLAEKEVYSSRMRRVRFVAATLALLISVTAIWGWTHPTPSKQVLRYTLAIDSSDALAPGRGWAGRIALSPDGSRLAYISGGVNGPVQQLAIRQRNELRATPVPATQDAFTPFFSPDGSNIGFLRQKSVWMLSPTGGPPIQVSDSLTGVAGASWGADGYIYVDGFESKPLARVEAKPRAAAKWFTALDTAKGEIDHMWPSALPNAKGVLFTVESRDNSRPDTPTSFAIAIAEIPSGKHRIIIEDGAYPVYVSSGHLLYVTAERTLMMVPFDQSSTKVTGKPTALLTGMRFGEYAATDLAVSSTGTLIYSVGAGLTQYQGELLWITRDGTTTPVDPDWQGMFVDPSISPDGKQLAISKSVDAHGGDVWIKRLDRGPATRLTQGRLWNGAPTWTPDGRSVTFVATSGGPVELWTQRADGTAQAVKIPNSRGMFVPRWSPDGKWLVFGAGGDDRPTQANVFGFRPGVDTAPVPLVVGKFMDLFGDVSPDGRWLAYQSDESGLYQIYVVPFPNTGDGKWAVTSAGGIHPRWGPAGNELFYRDTSGDIFAVPTRSHPTFASGQPKRLFGAKRPVFPLVGYAVARDDKRLLMVRLLHPGAPDTLVVVENWFEELKAKARN